MTIEWKRENKLSVACKLTKTAAMAAGETRWGDFSYVLTKEDVDSLDEIQREALRRYFVHEALVRNGEQPRLFVNAVCDDMMPIILRCLEDDIKAIRDDKNAKREKIRLIEKALDELERKEPDDIWELCRESAYFSTAMGLLNWQKYVIRLKEPDDWPWRGFKSFVRKHDRFKALNEKHADFLSDLEKQRDQLNEQAKRVAIERAEEKRDAEMEAEAEESRLRETLIDVVAGFEPAVSLADDLGYDTYTIAVRTFAEQVRDFFSCISLTVDERPATLLPAGSLEGVQLYAADSPHNDACPSAEYLKLENRILKTVVGEEENEISELIEKSGYEVDTKVYFLEAYENCEREVVCLTLHRKGLTKLDFLFDFV